MNISEFDYKLPQELIAQHPAQQRTLSRLLVSHADQALEHRPFSDLVDYLKPGDMLVLNETRVSAFVLEGIKLETCIPVSCLFMNRIQNQQVVYEVMAKPLRRLKKGTEIRFSDELQGIVVERLQSTCLIQLMSNTPDKSLQELINAYSRPPLPPYIQRKGTAEAHLDRKRYQTVYARVEGSVAAPTAGLHFSKSLLETLQLKGVTLLHVALQVGPGTFTPLRTDVVEEHVMHEERYSIPEQVWATICTGLERGNRLFAVGTTTVRSLESVLGKGTEHEPALSGSTDLFIYPGYTFTLPYSGLITNFHLPRSTLLLLVSALAGRERMFKAYEQAVKDNYRFFSFGDAMLILNE